MLVTSLQEANKVSGIDIGQYITTSCCDCDLPLCPVPTIDCLPIIFSPCGYSLSSLFSPPNPYIDNLGAQAKIVYTSRIDSLTRIGSGDTSVYDNVRVYTSINESDTSIRDYYPYIEEDGDVVCSVSVSSSGSTFNVISSFEDGELVQKDTTISNYSLDIYGECTGSIENTSEDYVSNETSSSTEDVTYCPAIFISPALEWSVSGATVSISDTTESTPPETYSETVTQSIALSNPVTVEYLTGLLEDAEYPNIDDIEFDDTSIYPDTVCRSFLELDPDVDNQPTRVSKLMYRVGTPKGYTRKRWELQWDEVFFPKEWEEWKALKDAYDAAVANHEAWKEANPATRGPEPAVPTEPSSEPDLKPSLVNERSWVWNGSQTKKYSDWFEMPAPSDEGENRIVNMMVICWRSSRIGQKPTTCGEIYEFPES